MSLYYRLMGAVAALCSKGSRFRHNGIPLHLLFPFATAAIVTICGLAVLDHARCYGKPPVPYGVSQAVISAKSGDYITLHGTVDSSESVTGSGDSHVTYTLIVDPKTKDAILVKDGPVSGGSISLTGLLTGLPTDLEKFLADKGGSLGSYSVDSRY